MNLKDRLDNITKVIEDISPDEKVKIIDKIVDFNEINIFDIFANKDEVEDIIISEVKNNSNIILMSGKSCDKILTVQFIKEYINELCEFKIIDKISNISSEVYNIYPEPSISDIVKILEYVIYGYKSFVFTLNMADYKNVIEKLKTVIAINYRNLTDENINTLIGASNAVLIYISKNEDGLFNVTNIDKIEQKNENISLLPLYSDKSLEIKLQEVLQEESSFNDQSEENESFQKDVQNNAIEDQTENISAQDERPKSADNDKVNKYKLLKIKFQKKHSIDNKLI